MTPGTSPIALCAALPVPTGETAPEWVHLLPAGEIRTIDGRGPYLVKSLQAIADTLKPGDKLPIDENHAIDRAGSQGQPSPARGWIVELQAREDGLWGRVEWTAPGRQLIEDGAYRGISPAILHDVKKNVLGVLRASLVNNPNLKGLTALHSEEDESMNWKARLIELLKLDSEADDAAVETALQSAIEGADASAFRSKLAKLLKLDDSADNDAIAVALQSAIDSGGKPALQSVIETPEYVALQSQLTDATTKLNTIEQDRLREKAETFVDAAIAEGRAGLNQTVRDQYIALHMEDAARAEKLIGAMPKLTGSTRTALVPDPSDDSGLTAADRTVMALMGISEDEMKESLKASGKQMEAL